MAARFLEWLLVRLLRLLTGAQARWQGCAPSGEQRVYFANHSSHLDFLLLAAALPPAVRRRTRPVAAADYWCAGPLRRYFIEKVFRGVLVDRKGWSVNPLEPMLEALRQGDSLIVFPEGTRGNGPELQPFKPGIAYLAKLYPGIDFVPVWIDNSYRILPKGFFFPVPLLCSMTFGKALRSREDIDPTLFLEEAQRALKELAS